MKPPVHLAELTMMVNNPNKQPVHDLSKIKALVAGGEFELVNRRARDNFKSLAWTTAHLKRLIEALCVQRHFVKTYFACSSEIGTVDADGYRIFFNEDEMIEGRASDLEFFIKLAIDPDNPSTTIISFHLSGQP